VTSGATVGVFGGSGLYALLDDVRPVTIHTPYGPPSGPLMIGELDGVRVAFLPRHGANHQYPPHRIPYRANVWAMREVGVRRIIAPCAAGSLRADLAPGTFVICDQYIDRTTGRADTYYDGPATTHVSAADPYCPSLRRLLIATAETLGIAVRAAGTMVVVQGPRFSTRAESAWYSAMGWGVINMTGYPEAHLARELGLCYANVSLITDYDVGVHGHDTPPVSTDTVVAVFKRNTERVRDLLYAVIPRIGAPPDDDPCLRALDGAQL
jgi:5'-methylthioadenosine phosphorylase